MIKWMKRKEKNEWKSEYQLYIRYDERTQNSIQQIVATTVNWNQLLNTKMLITQNEKDLSDTLKYKQLYIYQNHLIRFIEKRDDIKVLIFDIAIINTQQQELLPHKTYLSNNDLVIDLDKDKKDEQEIDIGKILSSNIVKGDIDV